MFEDNLCVYPAQRIDSLKVFPQLNADNYLFKIKANNSDLVINRGVKDIESLSSNTTIFWMPLKDQISGSIYGAIGVQSDLDRNYNCLPKPHSNNFGDPSYVMVLDSNFTVNQHWCNSKEVATNGYDELVYNTRTLLNKTLQNSSVAYPAIGHYYCPVNGHLTVRITALKFDAPEGSNTYYISTGQNEELEGALEKRFKNLMSKDLRLLYIITILVYIVAYGVSLITLESVVLKRIVGPIIDITIRIRNPLKMSSESQFRPSRSSSGQISSLPHNLDYLDRNESVSHNFFSRKDNRSFLSS